MTTNKDTTETITIAATVKTLATAAEAFAAAMHAFGQAIEDVAALDIEPTPGALLPVLAELGFPDPEATGTTIAELVAILFAATTPAATKQPRVFDMTTARVSKAQKALWQFLGDGPNGAQNWQTQGGDFVITRHEG